MTLRITKAMWNELRQHGEETYPHECCGVMVGEHRDDDHRAVSKVVKCGNTRSDSPQNRYQIAPADIAKIQRDAILDDLDIVGFYHSHPDDRAIPSKYDLDHAWPTYSYIVVAVEKGRAGNLRSWEMESDRSRFNEEEMSVP